MVDMNPLQSTTSNLPIIISIISIFVALLGASPLLIQAVVYRLFDPGLDFDLQYHGHESEEIDWWRVSLNELLNRIPEDDRPFEAPTIQINNTQGNTDVYLDKVEIVQKGDSSWDLREGSELLFSEIAPRRFLLRLNSFDAEGFFSDGVGRTTDVGFFPTRRGGTLQFPFEPEPEDIQIELIVHMSVNSNEISIPFIGPLPRLFGRIQLHPLKKTYHFRGED